MFFRGFWELLRVLPTPGVGKGRQDGQQRVLPPLGLVVQPSPGIWFLFLCDQMRD
jgi:hypothetical protein